MHCATQLSGCYCANDLRVFAREIAHASQYAVNSANGTVVGSKHVAWATVVPYAALIAVFGVINIALFVLTMAMRM